MLSPVEADARVDRQPRAFWALFLTEMWERYSYFANRSILVLFLVARDDGFALSDVQATAIYGLFTAATYLAGLPGGWIGDRITGAQRAVLGGGAAILVGNLTLFLAPTPRTFYLGLIVIVFGVGMLKPNVSTMVAALYRTQPERLDSAFTLYYMGICIGAALAGLVAPLAATRWGWRFGYAAAAAGMTLGLAQFAFTRHWLGQNGRAAPDPAHSALRRRMLAIALAVAGICGGVVYGDIVTPVAAARIATALIVLAACGYFGWAILAGTRDRTERDRTIVIAALCAGCALFWSGADLAGSALNLFAERYTSRDFSIGALRFTLPAGVYQSINPLLIIALSPLLSMLWTLLARRRRTLSVAAKFSIGLLLCGAGLALMALASSNITLGVKVGSSWLIWTYAFHTIGEMLISPLGLAAINRLAPERLGGQMVGVWFLSVALGTIMASQIAGVMGVQGVAGMAQWYWLLTAIMGACAVLFWLAKGRLRSRSHLGGSDG